MRTMVIAMLGGSLSLAGCGKKAPVLPTEPAEQAAACGAIQAASEQEAVGATGHLSAEAQERVLHYALIASSGSGSFDADTADRIVKRTPVIFDKTVKGEWKTLKPACAAAYPATAQTTPILPDQPFERALQCYVVTDFMRKALGQIPGRYADETLSLGILADKLDREVGPEVKRQGLKDEALQARKNKALAAAAGLGSPPAVIAACGKAFG